MAVTPHIDQIPPQNLEAERAVLGAMLMDADAANIAAEILEARDFYPQRHQLLFESITRLTESDRVVELDILLVRDALGKENKLEAIGGSEYLLDLANSVPSAAHVEHYAELIKDDAGRRHLIQALSQVLQQAFQGADGYETLLGRAEEALFEASSANVRRDFATSKDVIQKVLDSVEKLLGEGSTFTGLTTDFYDLDNITGGLRRGELIVLGGRPSCGKTTLALNVALHAALKGLPVGIFSLEMKHEGLLRDLLSMESRVSFHKEDGLYLRDEEMQRIMEKVGPLTDAPIFVDETGSLPIAVLRARARRLRRQHKAALFIVDYLQLVTAERRRDGNREQEIAFISRNLKAMAKELDCPVLALSQLNREAQKVARRPNMADLRESGAIEQDADIILLLSRENPDDEQEGTSEPGMPELRGTETGQVRMHLDVAKNRNGPTRAVSLQFHMNHLRFESLRFGTEAGF